MGTVTNITKAKYSVGDIIHHRLFGYRGVIVDVDRDFQLTDEWYEQMAKSQPPKNKPWYSVLVDKREHSTYVSEQNLELDDTLEPINHPMVKQYFGKLENGRYLRNRPIN